MPVAAAEQSVTVLFGDISGSTLLYAVRGDEEAYRLTASCLTIMDERVSRAGGRVVKRLGDAVLAIFGDAVAAVHAADAIQHTLEEPDCPLHDDGIHVRIGIASGTALVDDDVHGDVVNIAARLVALAGADEILLSGETYEQLSPELQESMQAINQVALRGHPTWVQVYRHLWEHDGNTTSVTGTRARMTPAALDVQYRESAFQVGVARPRLTIGRAPDNDIAIDEKAVSRHHAVLEVRGDRVLLIDRSTNGSYVVTDTGDQFRVLRDELALSGSGRVLIGRQSPEPIRYRCVTP